MDKYTSEQLAIMYHDSLERIVLKLQGEVGALRAMNLSRIKWEEEYREIIEYARGIAQAEDECEGWDDQWCPTSCKWWRVCEPHGEVE